MKITRVFLTCVAFASVVILLMLVVKVDWRSSTHYRTKNNMVQMPDKVSRCLNGDCSEQHRVQIDSLREKVYQSLNSDRAKDHDSDYNPWISDDKVDRLSPEYAAHKLLDAQLKFTMRSESNSTVLVKGFDTGVSQECLERDYGDTRGWPTASVVLPFCNNEQLPDLMHTVHSIIQRSPPHLLKEVILIDDNTEKDDFKELLHNYCDAVFGKKVRIIRSDVMLGLIQGRLLGARLARGEVVITMDAHMEVQPTWLEALLYEIKKDKRTLATAMLDWMKPLANGKWQYEAGTNSFMCLFSFDLGFGFGYPRPEIIKVRDESKMNPFPAPCSVGTIWAIDKEFFTEIGELDEGMKFWGGENLDLPIRAWLFGGRAIQVPCSHAAHLERPHQRDYRGGWSDTVDQNYRRVVEVWFDEYKHHVYRKLPKLLQTNMTDISERLKLKKKAKHDFKWFLSNVYPELGLFDNDSFAYDGLRNLGMNKCFHSVGEFILWECTGESHKEGIWWTTDGHFRTDVQYWHIKGDTPDKYLFGPEGATGYYKADFISKWIHWKKGPLMIYKPQSGVSDNLCLEGYDMDAGSRIRISKCDLDNPKQLWEFSHYTKDYDTFMSSRLKSRFNADFHSTLFDVMDKNERRLSVIERTKYEKEQGVKPERVQQENKQLTSNEHAKQDNNDLHNIILERNEKLDQTQTAVRSE